VYVCNSADKESLAHEEAGHTSFVFQSHADDVQADV